MVIHQERAFFLITASQTVTERKTEFSRCPNSPGMFQGQRFDFEKKILLGHTFNLPCKSWDCPYCNPRRILQVRSRVYNGSLQQTVDDYIKAHPENKNYVQKMFTFTYPGLDSSKYKNNRTDFTPDQAYDQMSKYWNLLRTALVKKYGKFDYFKILERQRDGYPHFHILLIGSAITPKDILEYIRRLWCEKYQMGFVWATAAREIKSFKHAVRYATKYLTKSDIKKKPGRYNIKKGARLFSASRGALQKMAKKKKYDDFKIFFGQQGPDGWHEIEVPMTPVKPFIRNHMADKLKFRVLVDEKEMQLKQATLRMLGHN